jgi:8-oxo-dGTP diphosphatase
MPAKSAVNRRPSDRPAAPLPRRLPDGLVRAGIRGMYLAGVAFCFLFRPALASAVVVLWHRDRLLLVRNAYRRGYSLPGGFCRRGEAPRRAAARELFEEVGVDLPPRQLRPVGAFRHQFEFKRDRVAVFEAFLPPLPPPRIRVDNREVVWADFLTAAECRRLPIAPVLSAYLRGALAPAPVKRTAPSRPSPG